MKKTDLAQLIDQLALALAEYDSANPYHDNGPLIARACQAVEEIEGRQAPTDKEIIEFWNCHCVGPGATGIIKLARFGGGEVK